MSHFKKQVDPNITSPNSKLFKQPLNTNKKVSESKKYISKIIKVSSDILLTEFDKNRSSTSITTKNNKTTPKQTPKHSNTNTPSHKNSNSIQIPKNKKALLSNQTLKTLNALSVVKSSKKIELINNFNLSTEPSQFIQMNNRNNIDNDIITKNSNNSSIKNNNNNNKRNPSENISNLTISTINTINTSNIGKSIHAEKKHTKMGSQASIGPLCLNNLINTPLKISNQSNKSNFDLVEKSLINNISSTTNNNTSITNANAHDHESSSTTPNLLVSNLNNNDASINTTNINISFINKDKESKDKDKEIFRVLENKLEDLLNSSKDLDDKKTFYVKY